MGGGIFYFGQGRVLLRLDGFAGLLDDAVGFFGGAGLFGFAVASGHGVGFLHDAVALEAGIGEELLVAGFQHLHLQLGLVGQAQGLLNAVLAVLQAHQNGLPGKLGQQKQHQQEDNQLPENQAEFGGYNLHVVFLQLPAQRQATLYYQLTAAAGGRGSGVSRIRPIAAGEPHGGS